MLALVILEFFRFLGWVRRGEGKGAAFVGIVVFVIFFYGVRCVVIVCVCILMGISSVMIFGLMLIFLIFISLVGLRRLGISCSFLKVRFSWVG